MMTKLASALTLSLIAGCGEGATPEGDTFTTADGRVAIGERRVMQRGTLPGWTPASDVQWGDRWFVGGCGSEGEPGRIALHRDPSMSEVSRVVVVSNEGGYCPGEPALVIANTRLDEEQDAIRVEFLNGGAIGWLRSGDLARRMTPDECAFLFADDAERRLRCEYGPPTWPDSAGPAGRP